MKQAQCLESSEINLLFWWAYLSSGVDKESSVDIFKVQYGEVCEWLKKKGYNVWTYTDAEDCVSFTGKTVFINSRNHPETKYYTLLHECGHVLINGDSERFEEEMPMYARSSDGRNARSKAYRVSTVAEELEAWKRGRRLATRLKHYVETDVYDKHITESVMSYIEWAANGGGI
jgi:hypothetical protein